MLKLRRAGLVTAAFALCALAAAGSASADLVPPPSLQGEQLVGNTLATDNCGADRTFTFTAQGLATGPYTGEFIESGTVAAGPAPVAGTGPTTLLSFEADFTITATDGTIVTGHKSAVVSVANSAICDRVGPVGFDRGAIADVSYTATIGYAFQDTGTGHVLTEDSFSGELAPVLGGGGDFQVFEESFDLSNGVVPVAAQGKVTGGGWIMQGLDRVSFGFEAQALKNGLHGTCSVIDHVTKAHIRCLTVDQLSVTGTHATFSGMASVSGATTSYRIDVDDIGEPGRLVDHFSITTGSSFVATGPLLGGNIQIHRS
jgi:hypothetical protein